MRILVTGGGTSSERDVSVKSAKAVVEGLRQLRHAVDYLDVAAVGDDAPVLAACHADLVFPILHGGAGEDGTLQELLDTAGASYLGSGAQTSRTCFDKVAFKLALTDAGIHTPPSEVVSSQTIGSAALLGGLFVLKPIFGGSSIDLVVERDPAGVTPRMERLVTRHGRMLLEAH